MRRRLLVLSALLLVPGVAHADNSLHGATIKIEPMLPDGTGWKLAVAGQSGYPFEHQFNLARCVCSESGATGPDEEFGTRVSYQTHPSSAVTTQDIQVWMGPDCDTATSQTRPTTCGSAPKDKLVSTLISQASIRKYSVAQLMDPVHTKPNSGGSASTCPTVASKQNIYIGVDDNNDQQLDSPIGGTASIQIDPEPPLALTNFTAAAGGDGRIVLKWDTPASTSDTYAYQLLCANADGTAVVKDPPAPLFDTPNSVCGLPTGLHIQTIPVTDSSTATVDAGPVDARVVPDANPFDAAPADANLSPPDATTPPDAEPPPALPAGILEGKKEFVCAETLSSSATSIEVRGLTNGHSYYVALLAIDKAGNATAMTPAGGALTPVASTDLWEELNNDHSDAQGGFCLIADTYGDGGGPGGAITRALRGFRDQDLGGSAAGRWLVHAYYDHVAPLGAIARHHLAARIGFAIVLLPAVALALLWHLVGLPGLLALLALALAARRVRLARLRPALTAGALLLVPRLAGAQSFNPYWDQSNSDQSTTSSGDSSTVDPLSVHWVVGVKLGPYTPALDQTSGVTGTPYENVFGSGGFHPMPMVDVGYILWHAPGGQLTVGGSVGVFGRSAPQKVASTGKPSPVDETKLRIIPIYATASYRLTYFDDEYGVPLVPYASLGGAYDIWYILNQNGEFAMAGGSKARGASLGIQGAIGLSVRAEEIDRTSSSSLHQTGLDHAGFYGEYQIAWINGFGSSKKLSVGDNTWFAGIDFEF